MFKRRIEKQLNIWSKKEGRKPLVLKGARQVGKTTIVNQFAKNFDEYLYLNLELQSDKAPFENFKDIETLIQNLFFIKNKVFNNKKRTLIFIDEIQEVPEAFNSLRYFYEGMPQIAVIAAGSLLETIFNNQLSFPVGRVEFMVVRPASFIEFLDALGENSALDQIQQVPMNSFAQDRLYDLFHEYALIGGMPEIIKQYSKSKDLVSLKPIYESILVGYLDDVEKYASNQGQVQIIRHVIKQSFFEVAKRIKFQGFGNSNYGSKEVGEALRTLEKALLIHLVYPTTQTKLPIVPNLRKSPRLHCLDTGLVNFYSGLQKNIIGTSSLHDIYQGDIIEHLVGQEILANDFSALSALNFWVREKNSSSAEVDYVISVDGNLIPIEVKSGKIGKLKSLLLFMDESPVTFAIRIYAGKLAVTQVTTPNNKEFTLLHLPYFLVSQIDEYIAWAIHQKEY